jgi:hypothetical protein
MYKAFILIGVHIQCVVLPYNFQKMNVYVHDHTAACLHNILTQLTDHGPKLHQRVVGGEEFLFHESPKNEVAGLFGQILPLVW